QQVVRNLANRLASSYWLGLLLQVLWQNTWLPVWLIVTFWIGIRVDQTRSTRAADDGLPMPYAGARQLYPTEWYEYRERQARHHARFPEYALGWRRPTEQVAEEVWHLVTQAR